MTSRTVRTALIALSVAVTGSAWAQDDRERDSAEAQVATTAAPVRSSIQLDTTSVTGSRELPKVLVIVPWKTSEALGPGERPLASLVEEALTPVDPEVFRRQLDYYTQLNEASASDGKGNTAK